MRTKAPEKLYTRNGNGAGFLDAGERQYIFTIRDLADEDKPRERLIEHGPASLSVTDLLAVVLTTGTTKEDVLTMAGRVMKEYGEKSIASQKNAKTLADDLDIPIGKATQIVACAELGRRFFSHNAMGAPTLRTAREVFEYVGDMRSFSKEHLRGIYLNAHYKVIHDEVLSIGTVDTNIIHPREVFKPAIEYSAVAVILVHNHPSGEVTPSANDIAFTKQLVEAGALLGIDLIDHIVVTKDSYASVPAPYRG